MGLGSDGIHHHYSPFHLVEICSALRLLGMSWGVKTTCLEAPGVSLGGSGVSIGGVGSLRVGQLYPFRIEESINPRNVHRDFSSNVTSEL